MTSPAVRFIVVATICFRVAVAGQEAICTLQQPATTSTVTVPVPLPATWQLDWLQTWPLRHWKAPTTASPALQLAWQVSRWLIVAGHVVAVDPTGTASAPLQVTLTVVVVVVVAVAVDAVAVVVALVVAVVVMVIVAVPFAEELPGPAAGADVVVVAVAVDAVAVVVALVVAVVVMFIVAVPFAEEPPGLAAAVDVVVAVKLACAWSTRACSGASVVGKSVSAAAAPTGSAATPLSGEQQRSSAQAARRLWRAMAAQARQGKGAWKEDCSTLKRVT